jgi:hypothetical protein
MCHILAPTIFLILLFAKLERKILTKTIRQGIGTNGSQFVHFNCIYAFVMVNMLKLSNCVMFD